MTLAIALNGESKSDEHIEITNSNANVSLDSKLLNHDLEDSKRIGNRVSIYVGWIVFRNRRMEAMLR